MYSAKEIGISKQTPDLIYSKGHYPGNNGSINHGKHGPPPARLLANGCNHRHTGEINKDKQHEAKTYQRCKHLLPL